MCVGVVGRESMSTWDAREYFELEGFVHRALFVEGRDVWEALGLLESYVRAWKGGIEGRVEEGAHLSGEVFVGEGSVVEAGAYVKGPCVIGKGCEVRQGAYVRGNVVIGDGCVIGHATEVKNAIFLNGAHAPHFAYVGDSIMGNGVNLGAGVICANLRLDRAPIVVRGVTTGRRKLGAIVGDGSQVGCNVVLNPGTLLGKGVVCYPSLAIGGVISAGSVIKSGAIGIK